MLTLFTKLLYVAALASAALAQSISIVNPPAGASVKAGTNLVIQLQRPVRVS